MGNQEALTELAKAKDHIVKAREEAERSFNQTEIDRLHQTCQDCIDSLESELGKHEH